MRGRGVDVALATFLYHRKLRKVLQKRKRYDIIEEQKDRTTKRGGETPRKSDKYAVTFKSWEKRKRERKPIKQRK